MRANWGAGQQVIPEEFAKYEVAEQAARVKLEGTSYRLTDREAKVMLLGSEV